MKVSAKQKHNTRYSNQRYQNDPEFRSRRIKASAKYRNKVKKSPKLTKRNADYHKRRHEHKKATDPSYLKRMRTYYNGLSVERKLELVCKRYGITLKDYYQTYKLQKGKCATCGLKFKSALDNRINKDHCHNTNTFRGLLCHRCNILLGHLERLDLDISSFIKYVNNPPANKLKDY